MRSGGSDPRLLLKVCYQFYRLRLSHIDIAEKLNVSRYQVARLLRTALDDGYVRLTILEPERWHGDFEAERPGVPSDPARSSQSLRTCASSGVPVAVLFQVAPA